MSYDSVVIGAGLSGLVCALLLARQGRRVAVVEQHPLPAPVVRGFTRGGHYFDTGFHYAGGLGEGGGFAPLLGYLGLADELELVPYDVTGFDSVRLMDSGETLAMPVGYARIEAALHQRFPQLSGEITAYLRQLQTNWSHFPYLAADVPLGSFAAPTVHGETLEECLAEIRSIP